MHIRTILATSALICTVGISSSAMAANKCGGEIHFAKGKSSTMLHGEVAGYNVCKYSFYAQKGQELIVRFNPQDRPQATLYNYQMLADGQPFILPKNGKYELIVGMTRNDARKFPNKAQPFTMDLSITAPQKTDSQTANAAASGFAGEYQRVLPCASCKGVDTYLALYRDGSYTLSETYLGRSSDSIVQQGNWMAYGNAIVLQPENTDADDIYLMAKNGDVYFVNQEEAGAAKPKLNEQYRLKHQ